MRIINDALKTINETLRLAVPQHHGKFQKMQFPGKAKDGIYFVFSKMEAMQAVRRFTYQCRALKFMGK